MSESFPLDLIKNVVVPIVKIKIGYLSDKCNYHPISLATVVAKVLDSDLDSELDRHLTIQYAQFGFRKHLIQKYTVKYDTHRRTPMLFGSYVST